MSYTLALNVFKIKYMIRDILALLRETDSRSAIVARAKGRYKLPRNTKEVYNHLKIRYKYQNEGN